MFAYKYTREIGIFFQKANQTFYILFWDRVFVNGLVFSGITVTSVQCDVSVELQRFQIIYCGQMASCSDKDFDFFLS